MRKDDVCGIYKITNIISKKIYIGSSFNVYGRFISHRSKLRNFRHDNPHLQNAWNLYGEAAFIYELIETVEDRTQIKIRESWWIEHTNCCDRAIGYNVVQITDTGVNIMSEETKKKLSITNTGKKHTDETKKKISEANKRRPPCSEETRKKLSVANTGKIRSKETCEKLSIIKKQYKCSEETKKKLSDIAKNMSQETRRKISKSRKENYTPISEDTRRKISESSKGRLHTEEAKRKIREWHIGKTHTDESKQKMSLAKIGKKPPNFGKKASVESRMKMSLIII